MSLNNSNKSLNSIGIPSIYFKNKSILNFNQLSTTPKSKNLQVSKNICENRNLSLYNEKMSHRIKRNVLTNPNYTEDQKTHAFKIIESKKRKINSSESSIKKKLCIENEVVGSSSDNVSNVESMNENLLIPNCNETKHLTSPNCIKNVDKECKLQDTKFLPKVQIYEESSMDETTIDKDNKDKCPLQDSGMEMISEASRLQKNDNKIIHLNLLDVTQSPNNYKAKSIFQLLAEIDNHRLSCSKKKNSGCLTFEKRFENIKALLSSDVNRNDNKDCLILSNSNHISNYSSQSNNSNSNSVIVTDGLPKLKVNEFKNDTSKICHGDISTEKLSEDIPKIINTTNFNAVVNSLNSDSVISNEMIEKDNSISINEITNSTKLPNTPQLTRDSQIDFLGKDNCKPTSSIQDSIISAKTLNDSVGLFGTQEKENNKSQFWNLEFDCNKNINNATLSESSVLSLNNEKDLKCLESDKNPTDSNSPASSNELDTQSGRTNVVSGFGITCSGNGVILSNNPDSSKLVAFSPLTSFLKSSGFSNDKNDSPVTSTPFSLGNAGSSIAPTTSNVFSFVTNASDLFRKSSIFDSSGSLTCTSSSIFNGKGHSSNILFNKSASLNNQESINSQPPTISVSNTVPVNGLFSQPKLSSTPASIQADNSETCIGFSSSKMEFKNKLDIPRDSGLFKNVIAQSTLSSGASEMTENKTDLFGNKFGQSNIDSSIHKTDIESASSNMFSFGVNATSNNLSSKSLTQTTSSPMQSVHQDDNSRQSSLISFDQKNLANSNNFLPITSLSANNLIIGAGNLSNNSEKFNSNRSAAFQTPGLSFTSLNETSYSGNVTNPMNNQQNDIEKPKINENTNVYFSKNTSNNFEFGQSLNEINPISNNKEYNGLKNTCENMSFLKNNISFPNTFAQNSFPTHPFSFGNTKNVVPNFNNNSFAFGPISEVSKNNVSNILNQN